MPLKIKRKSNAMQPKNSEKIKAARPKKKQAKNQRNINQKRNELEFVLVSKVKPLLY